MKKQINNDIENIHDSKNLSTIITQLKMFYISVFKKSLFTKVARR